MNECHFKPGLYRVARPVERNPNYRDILGTRVDTFFEKFSTGEVPEAIDPEAAVGILRAVLQGKQLYEFFVPPNVALAFGKTRNNLREFEFLRAFLAGHGLDNRLLNAGLVPPRMISTRADADLALTARITEDFFDYCSEVGNISKPVLFQLINYAQAYLGWRHTFGRNSVHLPRVLVLANDHSPGQVACSMAAKERGIDRIYIQHAEVSESFPPLDFELSILRNDASRRIYESIGPTAGKIFAVSREQNPFMMPQLRGSDAGLQVGVYLTSQVEWEGVRGVLMRLRGNPRVHRVFLKPHPSMRLHRVQAECPGVEVLYEAPTEHHLAVVANSSVVIELLHRGIPVVQFYGMDSVPEDYYGFSRQGITPCIKLDEFSHDFWNRLKFDDDWLYAYGQYNPLATSVGERDKRAIAPVLRRWFPLVSEQARTDRIALESWQDTEPGRNDEREQRTGFGVCALRHIPVTAFDYLARSNHSDSSNNQVLDRNLIAGLERLFAERDAAAFRAFDLASRVSVSNSAFIHFAKRRDIELSGRCVTDAELEELVEFALRDQQDPAVRRRREYHVFFLLLRLGRVEMVAGFLARAQFIRYEGMHINNRIAVLRWARKSVEHMTAASLDPTELYRGLTPFHRLKLQILSSTEELFRQDEWHHAALENAFVENAPVKLADSYRDLVEPVYARIRERMMYMDVRWCDQESSAFFGCIKNALAAREPFSMIRLSDGEAYAFYGMHEVFTSDDARNRERHWWGEELPEARRSELATNIRAAAANADILGIPCIYRFLRDSTDRTESLLDSITARGLIEVLAGVEKLGNDRQYYTEEKANLPLFSDLSRLKDLYTGMGRIVVIGSASENHVRALFNDAPGFVYILVPTHARTSRNEKYESFGRPLPYVYKSVQERVAAVVQPGDLVLVAAGVAGKVFVDEAKRAGGVALDVGSSLDEWVDAGIHSLH